jgi:hypothetical protein
MIRFAKIGRLYRLVKLTKLLRVLKLAKQNKKMMNIINDRVSMNAGRERISFLILITVVMMHVQSCIWVMLP